MNSAKYPRVKFLKKTQVAYFSSESAVRRLFYDNMCLFSSVVEHWSCNVQIKTLDIMLTRGREINPPRRHKQRRIFILFPRRVHRVSFFVNYCFSYQQSIVQRLCYLRLVVFSFSVPTCQTHQSYS